MNNKDNFIKLVSAEKTDTNSLIKQRIKNRSILNKQQDIALKLLVFLDNHNINRKDFYKLIDLTEEEADLILRGKIKIDNNLEEKINNLLKWKKK